MHSAQYDREVTVIIWSDGGRNVFYSFESEYIKEFINHKTENNNLTYRIEKCMKSEYDIKYNSV